MLGDRLAALNDLLEAYSLVEPQQKRPHQGSLSAPATEPKHRPRAPFK